MAEAKTSKDTELVETVAKTVMETQKALEGTVIKGSLSRMTAAEYKAMSKKNGTVMGRKKGQKTKMSAEELRILINEKWTPEEIMEKHGLDKDEYLVVTKKLAKAERK